MSSRVNRLLSTKAPTAANGKSVDFSIMSPEMGFPVLGLSTGSGKNLKAWIDENREEFKTKLRSQGGILFRGFGIDTVAKFQDLIKLFVDKPLEYKMRSSPRYAVGDNVYHTTTYPSEYSINMHSESSYDPNHPSNIVFCCIVPAEEQGETPIADNRKVLQYLSDATRQKFVDLGVKYVRNLTKSLGLPWQEVFQTTDKNQVEEICAEKGITCNWADEDKLVLTWTKKAVWDHPHTGDTVWFNHGYFFNKYTYDEDFLSIIESDDDLPNNTYFGDGSPISKEEIEEIRQAYKKATFEFPWQTGDVLFLDNMLMAHGRNPYKGDRKIIASIF
ncbi:TauD/TfdA family dioxygenase [Aureisphaera galaxeae]|uniref:TauD/TfdA family dioxygenase n=1 Tax=Aureisphaera galaxeae TaxID=1538023 RepID=UPI0023509593|nr:TauD/TfdA family dioxygenase [Aureisphaera galaxeae]MDC8004720.1 TauD/TfdA family dioxygenase [Aureisphaera galaxeae]